MAGQVRRWVKGIFIGLMLAALIMPGVASARTGRPAPNTYDIEIQLDWFLTGPDTAAGPFALTLRQTQSGKITADQGQGSQVFGVSPDGTQAFGRKTLVGGRGTLTIEFAGEITWTGPDSLAVHGNWTLVEGTGRYSGLRAAGEVDTTVNFTTGAVHAVYTGSATQGRGVRLGR